MYLQEHIIHVWEEIGADFHNCLIQLYCEKVQGLMKEYLHSLPAGMFSIFWWKKQGMEQCREASIVYCSKPALLIPILLNAVKELEQWKLWVYKRVWFLASLEMWKNLVTLCSWLSEMSATACFILHVNGRGRVLNNNVSSNQPLVNMF